MSLAMDAALNSAVMGEFGQAATLHNGSGDHAVTVVFRSRIEAARLYGLDVSQANPEMQIPESALAAVGGADTGHTITLGSSTYRIANAPLTDSGGMTTLILLEYA